MCEWVRRWTHSHILAFLTRKHSYATLLLQSSPPYRPDFLKVLQRVALDAGSCGQEGFPVAVCITTVLKKPLTENTLLLWSRLMKRMIRVVSTCLDFMRNPFFAPSSPQVPQSSPEQNQPFISGCWASLSPWWKAFKIVSSNLKILLTVLKAWHYKLIFAAKEPFVPGAELFEVRFHSQTFIFLFWGLCFIHLDVSLVSVWS